MQVILKTQRLFLREILPSDRLELFEMDSNPLVHQYIYKSPVETLEEIDQAIHSIRTQYLQNGIARWAVISAENEKLIGWCGLKLLTEPNQMHFGLHDLGYRFNRKYWGKGYAYEAALAVVDYARNKMKLHKLVATVDPENVASIHILKKLGFHFLEQQEEDGFFSIPCELIL